jgi:cytochrome P450
VEIEMNNATGEPAIPAHVPAELVREFSHMSSPGMLPEPGACPFRKIQGLYDGPRIYWCPPIDRMLEGNWVITRSEDMRAILRDPETFSSRGIAGFSHLLGETWDMIPLEVDPPDHQKYRTFLNPLVDPGRIMAMADSIRSVCVELIEDINQKGSCEFIGDFARRFPVRIFMQLMGMPLQDYHTILKWEDMILHSPDMEVRIEGAHAIRDYLVRLLEAREARPGPVRPEDDLLTHIAKGEVEGRPMTATEQLSTSLFLFVAGLDTVASALGYIFRYLATHPDQQRWLREDTGRIPTAMEELYRAFAVVVTSRRVTRDVEIAGVQIKQGDSVSLPLALANYDPEAVPKAAEIDLERRPNAHATFSLGPHRCLGTHLARKEVAIAVEEWLRRMPGLRLVPGTEAVARGGAVFGVDEMHLAWG